MHIETRLFIADLTHLDCAWIDPSAGLTGETWRVDAELGGELGEDGMLCDFGEIRSRLKRALDDDIDHRLLLGRAMAATLQEEGGDRQLEIGGPLALRYRAPEQAFALLDVDDPDPENLAALLSRQMLPRLPDNIRELQLRLTPAHERGHYRYCHGLRLHEGNCQRMAHGHRARMELRVDGQRDEALEHSFQQRLSGRYIGAAADLAPASRGCLGFAYRASQGRFELELPQDRVQVLEAEPTVESISAFTVAQLASEMPGRHIECRAFEGIGKGAISHCAPARPGSSGA